MTPTRNVTDVREAFAMDGQWGSPENWLGGKRVNVTEEMIRRACYEHMQWEEGHEHEAMRAALQAALSSAMPGWVSAEELRGLCEEWQNMKVPMSANSYELGFFDGYHGARYDLEKLLPPPPETK